MRSALLLILISPVKETSTRAIRLCLMGLFMSEDINAKTIERSNIESFTCNQLAIFTYKSLSDRLNFVYLEIIAHKTSNLDFEIP